MRRVVIEYDPLRVFDADTGDCFKNILKVKVEASIWGEAIVTISYLKMIGDGYTNEVGHLRALVVPNFVGETD